MCDRTSDPSQHDTPSVPRGEDVTLEEERVVRRKPTKVERAERAALEWLRLNPPTEAPREEPCKCNRCLIRATWSNVVSRLTA
jgi:hypothetical protein